MTRLTFMVVIFTAERIPASLPSLTDEIKKLERTNTLKFFDNVYLTVTLDQARWCHTFLTGTTVRNAPMTATGCRRMMPGTYQVKEVIIYDGQMCVVIDDDIAPGEVEVIVPIGV